MNHIDLFSGIGGFALAAKWTGFETIVFCEKDEFCQRVLQKRFGGFIADSENNNKWKRNKKQGKCKKANKGKAAIYLERPSATSRFIPIIPEIRDFDGTKWKGATLLTGGFPCQPFSVAGKRKGKEDDRYLWPEMLRVIKEAKPRWILAENVAGIFKMALDTVLADLESEGYTTGTVVIPAAGINAPHRRDRIWIIANSSNDEYRGGRESLQGTDKIQGEYREKVCSRGISRASQDARNTEGNTGDSFKGISEGKNSLTRRSDNYAPDSDKQGLSRITCGKFSSISSKAETFPGGKLGRADAAREQWKIPWIEVATRFCRVDDGVPNRVDRLKSLGNAIVPQVAEIILRNIAIINNI